VLSATAKDIQLRRPRPVPGHGLDFGARAETKVFWFFSSEKNILVI
jgi:hypothetical protein